MSETQGERKTREREELHQLTPFSLPTNPSQAGYTAPQIKYKMYKGYDYLHDLIDSVRTSLENNHFTKEEAEAKMREIFDEDYASKEFVLDATSYMGEEAPSPSNAKVWLDVQGVVSEQNNETPLSYSKEQAYEETEYTFNSIDLNEELHFNN